MVQLVIVKCVVYVDKTKLKTKLKIKKEIKKI